jgi:hypothetical protein
VMMVMRVSLYMRLHFCLLVKPEFKVRVLDKSTSFVHRSYIGRRNDRPG